MNEGFSTTSEALERRNLIEAHAKFDAKTYISLMGEEFREGRVFGDAEDIFLDQDYSEAIIERTAKNLKLNKEELGFYLQIIKKEITDIFRGKREEIN